MKILQVPQKVNATVVRLVGAQVFILSILFLATANPVFISILFFDFLIRAAGRPRLSPLALLGLSTANALQLRVKPIFFAPKRFAASIGLTMAAAALALTIAGFPQGARGVVAVLGVFSFLESGFGFCAGCKIYALLAGNGIISSKHCRDCVS